MRVAHQSLAGRLDKINSSAYKSVREREREIIEQKRTEIADLSKRKVLFLSKEKRKIKEEIAHTLPLECFGVK